MGSTGRNIASSANTNTVAAQTSVSNYTYENPNYELNAAAEKNLSEGNTYAFGHEFLKAYPDLAAQQGFDLNKAVNRYRAYIEYNDGIFTFYGEDSRGIPTKYFFDEKLRFRGTKQ